MHVVGIIFATFMYLFMGFLVTLCPWITPVLDEIACSDEETAALWTLSIVLWPLWLLALSYHAVRGLIFIGRGFVSLGIPVAYLGRGFASLYRSILPRKVKLPRAVARRGRVSVVVSNAVAEGDIIAVACDGTYEGRKP